MEKRKKAIGLVIVAFVLISVATVIQPVAAYPHKEPFEHGEKGGAPATQISLASSSPTRVSSLSDGAGDPGNLEFAPMYVKGTSNNIVMTDCPEIVSYDYWWSSAHWLDRYVYEGGTATFTVTFKNLDTVSHTLDFSYALGSIAAADISVSPNPVTIPGGEMRTVIFTINLSDTSTYPASPLIGYIDYYEADYDISYDAGYASTLNLLVCPISLTQNIPNIWLWEANLATQSFQFQNMGVVVWRTGSYMYNFGDLYNYDHLVDYVISYDLYDEIGGSSELYTIADSELVIEPNGDVLMIDHATFNTLPISWTQTWYMAPDSWWVRTTDEFCNVGDEPVNFSYTTRANNYADNGTAIKVPGVYDEWTLTDNIDPFGIPASQMTSPVIYECDLLGNWSTDTPGAFGAIVFPDRIPSYNSGGVAPATAQDTALYFYDRDDHFFYYRVDLDPDMCEEIDVYYVFTDSLSNAEKMLYDAVNQILPKQAPTLTPIGLVVLVSLLATLAVLTMRRKRL